MAENRSVELPPHLRAAAEVLNRGSESVRAVLTSEDNRFARALEHLRQLAVAEGFPMAIVGGLAAIRYGYPAATQDIDIVVGRDHLDTLIRAAPRYGFKVAWEAASGWSTLTHGDVEINVVPEGGKARASSPTTIPGPPELGVPAGVDYANLPGWIELKISSGRLKDRAHVVEVVKKSTPEDIRAAREHIGRVHETYARLFDRLREEAAEEKEQEGERGGER